MVSKFKVIFRDGRIAMNVDGNPSGVETSRNSKGVISSKVVPIDLLKILCKVPVTDLKSVGLKFTVSASLGLMIFGILFGNFAPQYYKFAHLFVIIIAAYSSGMNEIFSLTFDYIFKMQENNFQNAKLLAALHKIVNACNSCSNSYLTLEGIKDAKCISNYSFMYEDELLFFSSLFLPTTIITGINAFMPIFLKIDLSVVLLIWNIYILNHKQILQNLIIHTPDEKDIELALENFRALYCFEEFVRHAETINLNKKISPKNFE